MLPPHGGVNSPDTDRKVGEGAPPGEEEGAGCFRGGKLGGSRCDSSVSDEVA